MKKIVDAIGSYYRKRKIVTKLLFIFCVFQVALTGSFLLLNNFYKEYIINQTTSNCEYEFEQAASRVNSFFNHIISVAKMTSQNKSLTDILCKDAEATSTTEQNGDMYKLYSVLYTVENDEQITRAVLYVNDGCIYSQEGKSLFSLASLNDEMCEFIMNKREQFFYDSIHYTDDGAAFMSIYKKINDQYTGNVVALLRLDFLADTIRDILIHDAIPDGAIIELYRDDGERLAAFDETGTDLSGGEALKINPSSESDYIFTYKLSGQELNLKCTLALSQIENSIDRYTLWVIFICFIQTVICFTLAVLIIFKQTKRLTRFAKAIEKPERTYNDISIPQNTRDEIDNLILSYNRQTDKIRELMDEQYKLGIKISQTELNLLYAQINPHFLYNTLNMVRYFCRAGRTEEAEKAITELISFYKRSLNNGSETATIGQEIEHASNYVYIQKMRYPDNFNFITEKIDEKILKIKLPKITLQPIIENAIIHGVLESNYEDKDIRIYAEKTDDCVSLFIEDHANGCDTAELEKTVKDPDSSRKHYGLYNIDVRLKMMYGSAYGIRLYNVQPHGLRVEIRLPNLP